MIMNLHTHTHHSPDGAPQTVADRVQAANALGLKYMAVTDHVEINRFYPENRHRIHELCGVIRAMHNQK